MHSSIISSSSEDRHQLPQRLPVNPRRQKVAMEARKRVIRACNACNIRRVKCTGEQPCQRCRKSLRECEYPAPETDKNALKVEVERLQRENAALKRSLQSAVPDEAAHLIRQIEHGDSLGSPATSTSRPFTSESEEGEAADGRLLCDGDGTTRFHGPTSGATFLDCLKEFMAVLVPLSFEPDSGDGSSFLVSIGKYQTFDSRPLPNPDVDPLWLPDASDMLSMLEILRHHIQDAKCNLPSGGIYWWGDMKAPPSVSTNSASMSKMTTEDSFRHLAFHHVCFALASSIGPASFRRSDQHTSEAYFMRARKLLGNPLDTVRFTLDDVPVLTLMGFYLIELNRRDAAYMYVSLAVHIAVIHGAFRSYQVEEPQKRAYWTLYVLERWLSVLLGRPPSIVDEAIKLPLPEDAPSMPPATGLRAHIELARISGFIVFETFKVAPRNLCPGYPTENIEKALVKLEGWRSQLPEILLMIPDQVDPDPAGCMLHMAHNQLIVLTTRPIFLAVVKQAVGKRYVGGLSSTEDHLHESHILVCSEAAHRNIILAQRIRPVMKFLQAGLHFVFNAAVILLLDRILQGTRDPPSVCHKISPPPSSSLHTPEIQFAIEVFEQEAKTGTNYPRDCCKVLHDLNALVDRYLSRNGDSPQQWTMTRRSHPDVDVSNNIRMNLGSQEAPTDVEKTNEVHEKMLRWVQAGGLQLRNSLLI